MLDDVTEQIGRIAAGDPEAKAWLYETFSSRLLRRLSYRYGSMQLDGEELLHEAYVCFFQHEARALRAFLERYPVGQRSSEQFETHLWDQACGVASNTLRGRRNRRRNLPEQQVEVARLRGGDDPEQQLVSRDLLQRLVSCLRNRGEKLHLYYVMRFVDGLSAEEIATVTGWSLASVYKLRVRLIEAAGDCARSLGLGG